MLGPCVFRANSTATGRHESCIASGYKSHSRTLKILIHLPITKTFIWSPDFQKLYNHGHLSKVSHVEHRLKCMAPWKLHDNYSVLLFLTYRTVNQFSYIKLRYHHGAFIKINQNQNRNCTNLQYSSSVSKHSRSLLITQKNMPLASNLTYT
jgi:hypothetical protein